MDFRPPSSRRAPPVLDMTPLIDVVFLLLVFFLVTATFAQEQSQSAVPVDLPDGATGEATVAAERITVYLQDDGTVTFEAAGAEAQTLSDTAQVRAALQEWFARDASTPVYLRGDREVPYGRVMEVLDAARAVGFRQVFNVVYASGD